MATYVKINDFVKAVAEKKVNLASDVLMIALSDTAPTSETSNPLSDGNGVLANVTEIAYTNLSTRVITITSSTQTAGVYKLVLTDLNLTSSGGTTGPFRYVYIYDDTATNKDLIASFDYVIELTLQDTDVFTVDFDATTGLLQLT